MRGILGYGAYVPYYRLQRAAIAAALGSGGGKGTRAVAAYDEDATSMSVEAARNMLRSFDAPTPAAVYLSTVTPPYLDKTNANVVHAALDMPSRLVEHANVYVNGEVSAAEQHLADGDLINLAPPAGGGSVALPEKYDGCI